MEAKTMIEIGLTVGVNVALVGFVGYSVRRWISNSERAVKEASERIQKLELSIIDNAYSIKVAIADGRTKNVQEFATKDDLRRVEEHILRCPSCRQGQ